MKLNRVVVCWAAMVFALMQGVARAEVQTSEHAIVGLFSPDRVQDLRTVMENVPEFTLVKLDYENARVTLSYDWRALFPDRDPKNPPKPREIEERLSKLLSEASEYSFMLKPVPEIPKEKLKKEEFKIGILDCKGCRYAAYLAVERVPGVEQANVSTDSIVTVWMDPSRTDRATIEESLKKARIEHVSKP